MKYFNLYKSLVVFALFLIQTALSAQQESMFSRYMFNTMTITPAYAGSHDALRFSVQARRQWLNFNGSPLTALASVDGVSKDERAGWGVLVGYEQIGLYKTQDVYGNYAYRFEMGEGKLALGIRAGATFYQNKLQSAVLADPLDILYANDINYVVPKMGIGAYYQDEQWYIGMSVPNMVSYRSGRSFSLNDEKSYIRRHYFVNAGFIIPIEKGVMLKPSILIKYVKAAPVQADINLQMYVLNKVSVGVGYRTGDAITFMAEVFPNENLRIGYSYDFTLSRIRLYGGGAHEIIVGYELSNTNKRGGNRWRMQDIKYF